MRAVADSDVHMEACDGEGLGTGSQSYLLNARLEARIKKLPEQNIKNNRQETRAYRTPHRGETSDSDDDRPKRTPFIAPTKEKRVGIRDDSVFLLLLVIGASGSPRPGHGRRKRRSVGKRRRSPTAAQAISEDEEEMGHGRWSKGGRVRGLVDVVGGIFYFYRAGTRTCEPTDG